MDARSVAQAWEWRDDVSTTLARIRSVGYVVQWGKKRITLVQSINKHQYGKATTIPRGCVMSVRELG